MKLLDRPRKRRRALFPPAIRQPVEMLAALRDATEARARCRGWDPEFEPTILALVLGRVIRSAKAGRLGQLLKAMPAYVA